MQVRTRSAGRRWPEITPRRSMPARADARPVRFHFAALARRMLGEAQPGLRQREPEGPVALVRRRFRHAQAVLRVAAVNVVGTHVTLPDAQLGCKRNHPTWANS